LSPQTHWARHTLFDFDIAAKVDAFTCGVRRAFEWVGGFRPMAEAHAMAQARKQRAQTKSSAANNSLNRARKKHF